MNLGGTISLYNSRISLCSFWVTALLWVARFLCNTIHNTVHNTIHNTVQNTVRFLYNTVHIIVHNTARFLHNKLHPVDYIIYTRLHNGVRKCQMIQADLLNKLPIVLVTMSMRPSVCLSPLAGPGTAWTGDFWSKSVPLKGEATLQLC